MFVTVTAVLTADAAGKYRACATRMSSNSSSTADGFGTNSSSAVGDGDRVCNVIAAAVVVVVVFVELVVWLVGTAKSMTGAISTC